MEPKVSRHATADVRRASRVNYGPVSCTVVVQVRINAALDGSEFR